MHWLTLGNNFQLTLFFFKSTHRLEFKKKIKSIFLLFFTFTETVEKGLWIHEFCWRELMKGLIYIWVRQVWNSFYLVYFDPHLKNTLKIAWTPLKQITWIHPYIWGISRCVKVTPPPAHPCNRKSLDPPTSSSGLVLTESMDWLRAMVASVFKLDVACISICLIILFSTRIRKKNPSVYFLAVYKVP